ncbi:hypothetical protein ABPG73_003924 [Tetrahymena malaccensis]
MIINFFLTFLLAFYLIICKTQIIYDDDVPFVFYKSQIFLRKYGDGSIKQEQQIDYSSKNFQSAPIVILGIGFYNNLWNPINQILFRLTSSSTTKTSCNISLIYDPNSSKLYGIQANLLAIDISQFPFVKIIDQSQKDIKFDNQYQFIEKRKYSPELQGNKNAIVVINGWKSSAISSEDVRFSLNVFVTIIDDQNYTITISTSQYSQTIVDVYYTIIEYVIDPPSMYGIVANYDEKYKAKTGEKCFYTNGCTNDQRYFPVQFNIVKLKNSQTQKQQYSNFFASINQFDFETKKFNLADGSDPRIQLVNFIYQQGKIQYEYNVWDNTICYGSTSSSIFFYKKLCLVNQYLLIDKQICQDDQPIGYYCKYIDQLYQCQNCKINDCQECTQKDTIYNCLKCISQFYLFNNYCLNAQPPNTYCDSNFNCNKCEDPSCLTCTNTNQYPQKCLTCQENQILYKDKCYTKSNPPSNTYCDWVNSKCYQCLDSSCLSCSNPNSLPQKCITCQDKQILYKGKCYTKDSPPSNTYCDWNRLECFSCQDSSCLSCSDPNQQQIQKCLTCQDNQILYKDKCYTKDIPPSNTYCDWINLKCQQCLDSSCLICNNPSQFPQKCLKCQDNQILYSDKCYTKSNPPNNTYCDLVNLKCFPCQDPSCLACSEPNSQPQKCITCQDKQILYKEKCYTKNSPPSNTFCDWNRLECFSCQDSSCLSCSDPNQQSQKCLTCQDNQILYKDKCYTKDNPPSNTYCDWINLNCSACNDPSCLTCSDPYQKDQKCLSCNKNYILNNNKCQNNKNSQVDNKKLEVSEIKETYEIINNQTYQAMQDTVKSASFLAVSSIEQIKQQKDL